MNDKKELQVAALENGTVIDHIPSEKLFTVVSLLGSKFNEKVLNIINKVCGVIIVFYGCKLLYSFLTMVF